MSRKEADKLLLRVLRLMRDEKKYNERYGLEVLGKSLILEYRDLNVNAIADKITKLEEGK